MDAAYKQYQYTAGMDIHTAVPFDAQGFLAQIQQGATINETEGWVQNLDQTAIQQALTDYQTQVKTYIDSQNPNATVGEVLGTQKIVLQDPAVMAGGLPYKTIATGGKTATLSDSLRWKYRTALYGDAAAYAMGDSPVVTLSQSTVSLAGKKITLSYATAGQADIDLINSYLPQPHADGSPIQPSELPSSLPGYLLNLKAELRADGELLQQATTTATLGAELVQAMAVYNPGTGQWLESQPNHPLAGEYQAIALDLQGIGADQLAQHKAKLEATQAKLEQFQANPGDTAPIQDLTKEDLTGDLLYSGILGYFAAVDGAERLAAKTGKQVQSYRMPSYGTFYAAAKPVYWYGIAKTVSFPGVVMDVDRIHSQVEAKDGDAKKRIAHMRQVGAAESAFEHVVPEKLFADPNKPADDPGQPQGVSAVKAIAIAAQQGQKIYTFTTANQSLHATLLAQISMDAEAKQEIQDALAAGKEVTVHASAITVSGWTGSGYMILDKDTGAGAYKISGGANGGIVITGLATIFALCVAFFQIVAFVTLAAPWVSLVAFLGGIAINYILATYLSDIQKVDLAANRMFGVTAMALAFLNAGYINFAAVSVFGAAMIFLYAFVDLLYTKLAMIFRQEILTAGMV